MNDSIRERGMTDFGSAVQEKRKAKGLTQLMLARKIGMTAVQLCKIENGNSSPKLDTMQRIAEALEVPLAVMLSCGADTYETADRESCDRRVCRGASRFVAIRSGDIGREGDDSVLRKIVAVEDRLIEAETAAKVPHSTMLPFVHSFKLGGEGAKTVARYVRASCASGSATFSDLAEMLEFRNVRIHLAVLPDGARSRSYYDSVNHSLTVVLDAKDTPERHVYRIAYELAWAVLFGSSGFRPVRAGPLRHRFACDFAAEFLMPEESVRFTVSQLGIKPNAWSLSMVTELKSKFNVSAEAFALRLEALGLISERLRQNIRDELREYYKKHPRSMEPKPALPPLKIGMRQKLLEIAASSRGAGE